MAVNYHVDLIQVGRGKVTKDFHIYAQTLDSAEHQALGICNQFLASRFTYIEREAKNLYGVFAGDRPVGKVIIKHIYKGR